MVYKKIAPLLFIILISMSRDRKVMVPLEEILDTPNIIVLEVKKQKSFSKEKKKRIFNWFNKVPPFIYEINYYDVQEIIYNGASVKIEEGQKIAVRSANFKNRLKRHKKYYINKISKSMYVYEYETKLDINTAERFIVFIIYNKEDTIFEYTVLRAYDGIDKKEKILQLLKK